MTSLFDRIGRVFIRLFEQTGLWFGMLWRTIVYTTATSAGDHTLRVRAAGTKNPLSTDTKIPVDAFVLLS